MKPSKFAWGASSEWHMAPYVIHSVEFGVYLGLLDPRAAPERHSRPKAFRIISFDWPGRMHHRL